MEPTHNLASSYTRAAVQGDDSYPRMSDLNTANQLHTSNSGQLLRQDYQSGSPLRSRSRSGSETRAPALAAPQPTQFQGQQALQQPQPYVEFVPGSS